MSTAASVCPGRVSTPPGRDLQNPAAHAFPFAMAHAVLVTNSLQMLLHTPCLRQ